MLIKRTERQSAARHSLAALASQSRTGVSIAAPSCAARVSSPAVSPRSARCRSPACARPRPARRRARRRGDHPQEHLHALRGRLHRHGGSLERRVDRPGAELGQPDQPRLALRQGRFGARARAQRPPAQISDEARQRPVDPRQMGPGHQRDRRQDDGDPPEIRAGIRSTGSARRNSPTKALISSASLRRSGAPTIKTTRRASAIRPPSPAWPIPGATAR